MNMRGINKMSAYVSMTLVLCFTGCLSKQPAYYTPYEPSGWTISLEAPDDHHLKQPFRWGIYPNDKAVVFENETLELALALWPVSRSVYFWMLKHSPLLLRMDVSAKQNVEIVCDKIHLSVPYKTTAKISPESVKINGKQQDPDTILRLSPGEETALQISYIYPGLFHNKQVFYLLIEGVYTNNSMVSFPVIRLKHIDEPDW